MDDHFDAELFRDLAVFVESLRLPLDGFRGGATARPAGAWCIITTEILQVLEAHDLRAFEASFDCVSGRRAGMRAGHG